jgi:hypothetical protein
MELTTIGVVDVGMFLSLMARPGDAEHPSRLK